VTAPLPSPSPVSFTVDPWDPGYGVAFGDELDQGLESSTAELFLGPYGAGF
jgi:hypothetical protein